MKVFEATGFPSTSWSAGADNMSGARPSTTLAPSLGSNFWCFQELVEGGLSEHARLQAMEIANDADPHKRPPMTKIAPFSSFGRSHLGFG